MFQCNRDSFDYRELHMYLQKLAALKIHQFITIGKFTYDSKKAVNSLEFPGSPPAQY